MFLGFFILKYPKSETLLELLAEAKLVVLSVTLSVKLHNQFGFRACKKFLQIEQFHFYLSVICFYEKVSSTPRKGFFHTQKVWKKKQKQ